MGHTHYTPAMIAGMHYRAAVAAADDAVRLAARAAIAAGWGIGRAHETAGADRIDAAVSIEAIRILAADARGRADSAARHAAAAPSLAANAAADRAEDAADRAAMIAGATVAILAPIAGDYTVAGEAIR